ncbi:MAG TPA: hypothetical protein VGD37_05905 [Kofleriaceae bacterium]|jgi:hypothetical protein
MIKRLPWSIAPMVVMVAIAASAACGTSSNSPDPPSDPIGFTFHTDLGSLSSIGWTGVFHNIKGDPGAAFGAKVTSCDNGVCQFDGPVAPVDPVNRRRCLYRTSVVCNADSDCPLDPSNKPTACVYIYDSPISTELRGSDLKVGACALTYIPVPGAGQPPTIHGKLNLVSGGLDISNLPVLLVLNGKPDGTFVGACPMCVGDPSPNDGKKEGTCRPSTFPDPATGHVDPGYSTDTRCDVNRYGDRMGYNFGYSMDCSPTLLPTPGTTPFGGGFSSAPFTISITDNSPGCMDPKFMNANCFCGMCNDTSRLACTKSSDCNNGVSCIGASMPGDQANVNNVPVAGNLCDPGECDWKEAEGAGTCFSTPLGRMIGCYPSANNGSKDGAEKAVSINAAGRNVVDHDVYYADTASAICTPAGMNAAVNRQVGLPGLTFQKRNFRIIPEFPEGQK